MSREMSPELKKRISEVDIKGQNCLVGIIKPGNHQLKSIRYEIDLVTGLAKNIAQPIEHDNGIVCIAMATSFTKDDNGKHILTGIGMDRYGYELHLSDFVEQRIAFRYQKTPYALKRIAAEKERMREEAVEAARKAARDN